MSKGSLTCLKVCLSGMRLRFILNRSGGIYMWFWARNDATVPQEVKDGSFGGDISAANWGVPGKKPESDHVDTETHRAIVSQLQTSLFPTARKTSMIMSLYSTSLFVATSCPGSCASFVLGNPLAFADAYFKLNSLRVFTANGQIASKAGPEGLSTGALAGIVVAAVVVALGLIGAFLWRLRRKRREAATARALAPRALNDLSTSSVISTTDSDKEEAGYPVGVLLPGETATRSKAHGSRDPRRGSASANTKKASKGSSSKKGYAATATTESGRASGANRPKQDVPVPPANPAFAFSNNQTKDKFRPGWAV
ncbi:hypothetical protein QFC21_005143 [Naganishia friedmannii]|uniref:Uncharacterized protein n=1 Tax=Naganishia friedmannii TaxID=89922 RepID=A0ACC2VAD6_9TREE|nr:hypothetical protein QFC21_005143 [Naganishia friedmannii]